MKKSYPLIPLSARALNFLALSDANDNGNSCDLVILKSSPSQKQLNEAVDHIAKSHPIMQSRIVRKRCRYFWQFDQQLFPEKRFLNWSEKYSSYEDWHDALRNYLFDDVIDPFSSSPVKFICIHYHQYCALLFISSHTASDARSGYLLFEQINAYLNSRSLDIEDRSFEREDKLFESCKVIAYFSASQLLLKNLTRPKKQVDLMHKRSDQWQVDYMDLGELATKKLVSWSKNHKVSVNVALNYILSQSICADKELNVLETMSVRDLSNKNLKWAYNNLIIVFESNIGGDNNWLEDYRQHLDKVKGGGYKTFQAQQEIQALTINLLPRSALKGLVSIYKKLFLKGNMILSNLGALEFDLSHLGEHEIVDIYNFSVPLPPAGLAFVVSTYRQKLRVSLAHRGDDVDPILSEIRSNILSIK
ncbi:WSD1 family O-acyltransferase [Pseudoalteromonas luteoviolacea]|uniref:WSD1 family O-acyltransferase n=1 Tax=Pseudoalteromonas luteoviolacea TaxID=43657 RepID=UPI00114F4AA8|nr:WSD1 family O-acyltransferase [Pseudoalteromonas luteoviolacea]TQF70975.1 WSD1 family O-acyltransferase [Pseudoalteromonas luteoviolacea]